MGNSETSIDSEGPDDSEGTDDLAGTDDLEGTGDSDRQKDSKFAHEIKIDRSQQDDSNDGAQSDDQVESDASAKVVVSPKLMKQFPSLSRVASVLMLLAGILVVGMLFYKVMVGFFIPLFMAAAMVVIFRPLHEWFLQKLGRRRSLAAVATTTVILSIVLLPIILLISVAIGQLTSLVSRTDLNDIRSALERGRARFGLQLEHADRFRRLDELSNMLDQLDEPATVQREIAEAKELIGFLEKELTGEAPNLDLTYPVYESENPQTEQDEITEQGIETDEVPAIDADVLNGRIESDLPQQIPAEQSSESETVEEELDQDDEQDDLIWSPVNLAILRLNEFAKVVSGLSDVKGDEDPAARIAIEERFHQASVVSSAAIHTWMNQKLGGSFWTQAKLLTNPSEKDLAEAVRSTREYLQPRFVKLSGVTGKVAVQLMIGTLIMVISIYFFFVDGPAMVRTLMRLSPLDDTYELRLLGEFEKTSRAVVLASILSALAQGILAAIAFFFCGFQSFILLFMVTTVMALIPFLGAASVWVPCAIYLAAVDQRYGAAIFLAIYGAAVVSSIDNVIKAYVLHGHSELHPLVALLSVLGGVPVFGPIGILVGPMVVVFLQTLLEILNHELELRDVVSDDDSDVSDSEPTDSDVTDSDLAATTSSG